MFVVFDGHAGRGTVDHAEKALTPALEKVIFVQIVYLNVVFNIILCFVFVFSRLLMKTKEIGRNHSPVLKIKN